jgi:CRISPR type III-A-associated protein Csm2
MALFEFNTESNPPKCTCDATQFTLAAPTASLFDDSAKALAEEISQGEMLTQCEEWSDRERRKVKVWKVQSDKDANKPTQIRKFYDEVCMWAEKTRSVDAFEKNLPFIKMMNAKVAYARGRELVDDKFVAWFSSCLSQIRSADEVGMATFQNFRTLFEAFIGFYKVARPK